MKITRTAVLTLVAAGMGFAADPFAGTWKPDVSKWKLSTGAPEWRKSEIITIEAVGKDSYRETTTTADGKAPTNRPATVVWSVDGKERSGKGDSSKAERAGDRHIRMSAKNDKGSAVFDWVVSADGKTLTVTRKGTGLTSGRKLDEVLVYSKQ